MDDRVLLIGVCDRSKGSRHVLFTIIETETTLDVDAPRVCHGREYETWAPRRRQLDPFNGRHGRYGCACRRSVLLGDDQIWNRLRRLTRAGERWVLATSNISER
jgi:hypothetical protein